MTQSRWRKLAYWLSLGLGVVLAWGILSPVLAQSPIKVVDPLDHPDSIYVQPAAPASPTPRVSEPEIRGVWLTTNDTRMLRDRPSLTQAMAQLADLNFNTVYPVIWNSGYVTYPSPVAQRHNIQPFVIRGIQDNYDILAEVINQAHCQGLLAIPWFEFGFMAPETSELVLQHPNWVTQRRDGTKTWVGAAGEVVWLNPFHPEVQKFMTDLVVEAISQYDVDGIQFDDHMSLPNEFGYDPYTVALYKQETKKDPPAHPQATDWVKWRADKITAFMKQLNQAIQARKPKIIVSVSPNPYPSAYNSSLQDWVAWINQDIVDELIVQIYRPTLEAFLEQIARPELQAAKQKIPTAVGILSGLRTNLTPLSLVKAKVTAAQTDGLGVAFFYYESLWNNGPEPPEIRQAGLQSLFAWPATRSRRAQCSPETITPASSPPPAPIIAN
ncbi:glycoside hydrolase family 10 protein [Thermosynechococcaceae cyanobacterium BACA0444]|uniref:Glycoside hydrolase family 10 protein n=1 Tax=Pseudocalidococcus azoricus BACA0444 TaxID=2918990 RepID=A0AAE4FS45_9CYAN|nr:glycoside hydrolase family 10 protein [Pseudocalidococcus azoricus]MDS3859926.1 glycoside hydrolase family 10 protein [Pseudocalidococcus azoricus BACA0444]